MIASLVLLVALAAAEDAPPAAPDAAESAAVGAPSVTMLKDRLIGATENEDRSKALEMLSRTAPVSAQDVAALFDLFSRYPDPGLRQKTMDSLALLKGGNPQLEPLFLSYLRQPEAESQLFGINGAFRMRSAQALPLVRKIAERKFTAPTVASVSVLSERNAWWTQYEALSVLAQWEGDKSLSLLRRKADESPAVARLLGSRFWQQTLPDVQKWASSADPLAHEKAVEASGAPIEPSEARATRDAMLAIVRDSKADDEVRHRLALKVGACSTDAETDALVAEHDKAADNKARLLWAAMVFAAHNPKSVPLLVRYAKQSPDESARAGARTELVDIVGEARAAALLDAGKDVKK